MHWKYFSERKGRREGGIIFLKAGGFSVSGSAMILFAPESRPEAREARSQPLIPALLASAQAGEWLT